MTPIGIAGIPAPQPAPVFDPWERYIVPAFPLEILPETVQTYIREQSAVIGCDTAAFAMSVLAAFSGALHHRFALKIMRNGNWFERPRLWILLVGDPSMRKTPIMTTVTRPLAFYETSLRVKYEADLRDYEMAKKDGDDKAEEPPPPPRYIVRDVTVEKLGEILARDPTGLLVEADEVSGWLASMERYNTGGGRSDRAFWNKAYDGGPYSIDRIRRGEIFVQNLSVSLLGGIQPARLAELQGLTSDGLLQRFLPVMLSSAKLPQDRTCNDENYQRLVIEMIKSEPRRLIMTDDALAIMNGLREHLFNLEQASGGLASGFQSFIGKLHGVCGSLALILHLARDPKGGAGSIGEETAGHVRRLVVDFILPHAYEFYCGTEAANGEKLRRLASWILTSGMQRVLASDLSRNVADCRGLALVEVNERVSPLVAAGWLTPADKTPVCRSWTVEPEVHVQLAERAKTEEVRKQALAGLMESPRKLSRNST
jgi:hypothetical protein